VPAVEDEPKGRGRSAGGRARRHEDQGCSEAAHRWFAHQDPLRPAAGTRKLTDFGPLREYRRSELYQYCDRPLGVEFILQLCLDPGASDARLEFDRSDADFGERDRSALDLLLPHLRQFLRARPSPAGLTPREREVIALVADGRTNGEVAHALGISPETVRKHLENAYEKLGVHTRTAAVKAAFRR
jgi:DNA-binding CsgD family transcriptional regulator